MPVCIAGMHRSGTSMVSRLLYECGLYLGASDDLLPASVNNQDGFWENRRFLEINESILNELGSGWDCPPPGPIDGTSERFDPFRVEAMSLLVDFVGCEPWGWKDPRNCLTLPFWNGIVDGIQVVIVVRNPLEVAMSLRERNEFSPALGLTLWQTSYQRLLQASAHSPRIVTHYDAYFEKPQSEVRRLLSFLQMPVPEDVEERSLSAGRQDLRHHQIVNHDLREAGISSEVLELYAWLCEEAGLYTPNDRARQGDTVEHTTQVEAGGAGRARRRKVPVARIEAAGGQLPATEFAPPAEADATTEGIGRISRSVVELEILRKTLEANRGLLTERDSRIAELEESFRQVVAEREDLQRNAELLSRAKEVAEQESTKLQHEQAERLERDRVRKDLAQERDDLQREIIEFRLQRLSEERGDLERRLSAKEMADRQSGERQAELEQRLAAALTEKEAAEQRASEAQSALALRLAEMLVEKEGAERETAEREAEREQRLTATLAEKEASEHRANEEYAELERRFASLLADMEAARDQTAEEAAERERRLAAVVAEKEIAEQQAAEALAEFERRLSAVLAEKEAFEQRAAEQEAERDQRLVAAIEAKDAADRLAAEEEAELAQWLVQELARTGTSKKEKRRKSQKKSLLRSGHLGNDDATQQLASTPADLKTVEIEGGLAEAPPAAAPRFYPGTNHLRFAVDFPKTLALQPPKTRLDPKRLNLHWLMSDFGRGMGGPMTIFRTIKFLEEFGHKNTIWLAAHSDPRYARRSRKMICEDFLPLKADVHVLPGHIDDVRGDAVIATHCSTAYPARAITNVRERFYFVQDFEPYFYPMGARYLLAEETYRFGFSCIAASPWLRDLLTVRYGAKAEQFDLAFDPSVYFPDGQIRRQQNHIAFYSRIGTERRVVELGLLGLERVAQEHPNLVVHFFGDWLEEFNPPYEYQNHGVVTPQELADLYRRVSLGVVFSSSNYSLIPNEMMACGLPVVELASPCTMAVFPEGVVALAEPNPHAIADRISTLLSDDDLRHRQSGCGEAHVAELTWEKSARQVEEALLTGILARSPSSQDVLIGNALPKQLRPRRRSSRTVRPDASFKRPIVFAGQPEYFRQTYFDETSLGTSFEFPFTSADPSALKALPQFVRERGARTCLVFRPEWLAWYPEVFDELKSDGVALIGYSTEPVPHNWDDLHPDQVKRLESLKGALKLDYDLIVHFDQCSLRLLEEVGFRRIIAHPLPVSEKLFFPEDRPREFDVCFLGRSTPHREEFLVPLKARYNTLHVVHGLTDADARILMNRSKMVVNIHTHEYPSFETRNVMALRCQRPLLSEQLSGEYLVAERDYALVRSPHDLRQRVEQVLTGQLNLPSTTDLSMFSIESLFAVLGVE